MSETLEVDVLIIGAGPAGLAAAIRYAQLCKQTNKQVNAVVLEKGAYVGAHILSGAVFDPCALNELLPEWPKLSAPLLTPTRQDNFWLLTTSRKFSLPVPRPMQNHNNYIISLGNLCQWLAKRAEELGVEIYPKFTASKVLFNEKNEVIGIETCDMGRDKKGVPKTTFQAGIKILAKQCLFAEGCRGALSQQLIHHYHLAQPKQPQTYAIGLKELWEISPNQHQAGTVIHTAGWPLSQNVYGGGFIYHWGEKLLTIGLVVGLDYANPYLNPYEEFQKYKHHPAIQPLLESGRCLSYGARAINEGGWQSLPKLTFPGGMLIGCSAGFLDVPKIKGSHNAMKSGMLAAEAVFSTLNTPDSPREVIKYSQNINESWIKSELYAARNIRPAFRWGLWAGLAYAAVETYLFRNKVPWTLSHASDHQSLKKAHDCQSLVYSKPDGKISFDKMTSVMRSNVYHEENQPCHLVLKDPQLAVKINWQQYQGPEQRYCPAGVYEYIEETDGTRKLMIHAANCIHCKVCDIKDPCQNIVWTLPEGGGGPNYSNM